MSHLLLFGFDQQLSQWACDRIPWMNYSPAMKAVGVATGPEPSDALLAVAVYHNYIPAKVVNGERWYNSVEMSFAAASPRFATRRTITNLLKIPFDQYKVDTVLVDIPSINERSIRFVTGIGFTPRGTLNRFFSPSVNACVFGLHRNQFKSRTFLKKEVPAKNSRPRRGQEHTLSTASA